MKDTNPLKISSSASTTTADTDSSPLLLEEQSNVVSSRAHESRAPLNADYVVVVPIPEDATEGFSLFLQGTNGDWYDVLVTPIESPTVQPSLSPTEVPSLTPTAEPSIGPTVSPSITPTVTPTVRPSIAPSVTPTVSPSFTPTVKPSIAPSQLPTVSPTQELCYCSNGLQYYPPTVKPTVAPTFTVTLPAPKWLYKFESGDFSGSTIYNYGTSSYDATIGANCALETTTKQIGSGSLSVDVSHTNTQSYVTLPTFQSTTGAASFALWVYLEAVPFYWEPRIFDLQFGGNPTGGTHTGLAVTGTTNGAITLMVKLDFAEQKNVLTNLSTQTWYHFAYVVGADRSFSFYLNGAKLTSASTTLSANFPTTEFPVAFLGRTTWGDPPFNGYIDNFYAFTSALSDEQVSALYTATS